MQLSLMHVSNTCYIHSEQYFKLITVKKIKYNNPCCKDRYLRAANLTFLRESGTQIHQKFTLIISPYTVILGCLAIDRN